MSLTNWEVGFPTEDPTNACMQISPRSLVKETQGPGDGHWRDVPCSKRNLVICEKKPMLSVPELQDILFHLRDNPGE
jgi:hypothetical protein